MPRRVPLCVVVVTVILLPFLPCPAAAQAVTGTIAGTVVDPQGQVIPGATVTVINEATNDSRATVSDDAATSRSPTCSRASTRVRVELAELPHARAQEHRPQRRRAAVGRHLDARGRQPRRDRRRRGARHARQRRRDAAQRPHHRQADRAGPGARPRRHVDHAAAARRALREHRRLARHELRHRRAERRRRAPRLEQRHRRRRRRQRGRRQQPDGAADQPRRDRRGARAAELLPRRVRARRRRPGADRQQERQRRTTTAISTTTAATRALNANDFFNNRAERQEAALPLQHLRRQPRRPGARSPRRSCSSSTRWRRRWSAARDRCATGRCRPTPRCRATSRRRSTARAG